MRETPLPGRPAHRETAPARTRAGRKKRIVSTLGNTLFYLLMALLLAGAFVFSRSDDPDKSLFGYRFYYIQTPSMEPEIPVGAAVFTRQTDPQLIQAGDVVTYTLAGASISHEVIEVLPACDETGLPWFRTKGIANEDPDPDVVRGDAVAGVVVLCVPYLGYVMSWVGDHVLLTLWLCVLACFLFALLRRLFRPRRRAAPKGSRA